MRLMETWAHGLDIKVAMLGQDSSRFPEDDLEEEEEDPLADTSPTPPHRLASGRRACRSHTTRLASTYPEQGVRVEVMGPKYQGWRFGPEDSDQVIRGMAGDWCRVVVQRQDPADTGLKAVGEHAERALEIARAY